MYADVFVDNVVLEKTENLLYKIPPGLEKVVEVGQLVASLSVGELQKRNNYQSYK